MDFGNCTVGTYKVATITCSIIVFSNILNALFVFGAVVAIFLIIISGIRFLTSEGDPKKVESARKTLTYSIIGFIVILLAVFIVQTVLRIIGVTCISPFFAIGSCGA